MRGLGATLEQAFEQAALALTAVITDLADVAPREMLGLSCEAPDAELLLVDWLNLLIYQMATRNLLFVEAAFLERDAEHGRRKFHLTARQAGEIARAANAGCVIPVHFSPRYAGEEKALLRAEVAAAFGGKVS